MEAEAEPSEAKKKSPKPKPKPKPPPEPIVYLGKTAKANAKLLKPKQRVPPPKKAEKPKEEKKEGEEDLPAEQKEKAEKKSQKSKKRAAKAKVRAKKKSEDADLARLVKRQEIKAKYKQIIKVRERRKKKEEPEKKLCTITKGKPKGLDEEHKKVETGGGENLKDTVYHDMSMDIDPQEHRPGAEPELLLVPKYYKFEEIKSKVEAKEQPLEELFNKTFQMYKAQEVMLSFNGGKDCTVTLHMLDRFFQKNHCLKHLKIPTLFITDPDGFPEVEEFVHDCAKLYNIELIKMSGTIKEALEKICKEKPLIRAVFMGCRRTDPHCQDLKVMQPTDPGWPPLMRINPILDWTCRDVWQYMYVYNVPYCILYQRGFTSIGNKKNSKPNPYLRVIESTTGRVLDYRPGHELLDNDNLERAGRV